MTFYTFSLGIIHLIHEFAQEMLFGILLNLEPSLFSFYQQFTFPYGTSGMRPINTIITLFCIELSILLLTTSRLERILIFHYDIILTPKTPKGQKPATHIVLSVPVSHHLVSYSCSDTYSTYCQSMDKPNLPATNYR